MTMLFAVFMARSRKAEFQIPFERPKMKTLLQSVGISVCGITIALVLSALAAFLSSAGADSSEDITKYPIWLAMIAFAIVPAVVEKFLSWITKFSRCFTSTCVRMKSVRRFRSLHYEII